MWCLAYDAPMAPAMKDPPPSRVHILVRTLSLPLALCAIWALGAGCASGPPPLLPKYAIRNHDLVLLNAPIDGLRPSVIVNGQNNVLADIASSTASSAAQGKLGKVLQADRLNDTAFEAIKKGIKTALPRAKLTDDETATLRLEVTVTDYGVSSSTGSTVPLAFVVVAARLVDQRSQTLVWQTGEEVTAPASDLPLPNLGIPGLELIGMAAAAKNDDRTWRKLFLILAERGGNAVVARMRNDAIRRVD